MEIGLIRSRLWGARVPLPRAGYAWLTTDLGQRLVVSPITGLVRCHGDRSGTAVTVTVTRRAGVSRCTLKPPRNRSSTSARQSCRPCTPGAGSGCRPDVPRPPTGRRWSSAATVLDDGDPAAAWAVRDGRPGTDPTNDRRRDPANALRGPGQRCAVHVHRLDRARPHQCTIAPAGVGDQVPGVGGDPMPGGETGPTRYRRPAGSPGRPVEGWEVGTDGTDE